MATPGDIPDQPHDHNFPKCEFGKKSKFTKVPGLADWNGCTMYDATSDLAFSTMMDAKSDKFSSFSESAYILVDFLNRKVLPDVLTSMKAVWNHHNISYQSIYIYSINKYIYIYI